MPKKVTKGRPIKLIGRRLGGRQILGFDGNLAERIHQCRGNVVGIAQGGLQILMRKRLTHHIWIGAHRHLQGGIGMPACVKKKKLYEQQIREESITQFAVCQLISLYSST